MVVTALLDPLELSAHHVDGKLEPSQQPLPIAALADLRNVVGLGPYLPGFGYVREHAGEAAMNRGELAGDLSQRTHELLELGDGDRGGGRGWRPQCLRAIVGGPWKDDATRACSHAPARQVGVGWVRRACAMESKPGDEPRVRAGFSTPLPRRQALAANLAGDRIRCPEAFSEHTTEVEDEAQSQPRVREPEPLEGRLRQDECLGLLERNDVGRSRKAVEKSDFTEEVAGLEHAYALPALVGGDENLEGAVRDDEEAAVEVALVDGELALVVQPRLRVLKDDGEIGRV